MQPFRRIVTRNSVISSYRFPTAPAARQFTVSSQLNRAPISTTSVSSPSTRSPASKAQHRKMSSAPQIDNTNIQTAPGVELDSHQKLIVGSVLDLFAGRATLAKLRLWADEGVFEDPITIAKGRGQYEPQWYGLQVAFSEIERLHHEVTSSGNPIQMDLKTRYVIKGIGKEQTIESKVNIFLDSTGKIAKVEDKWNGKLPESGLANSFRRLNANSVPFMIHVPKTDEEDAKRGHPKN